MGFTVFLHLIKQPFQFSNFQLSPSFTSALRVWPSGCVFSRGDRRVGPAVGRSIRSPGPRAVCGAVITETRGTALMATCQDGGKTRDFSKSWIMDDIVIRYLQENECGCFIWEYWASHDKSLKTNKNSVVWLVWHCMMFNDVMFDVGHLLTGEQLFNCSLFLNQSRRKSDVGADSIEHVLMCGRSRAQGWHAIWLSCHGFSTDSTGIESGVPRLSSHPYASSLKTWGSLWINHPHCRVFALFSTGIGIFGFCSNSQDSQDSSLFAGWEVHIRSYKLIPWWSMMYQTVSKRLKHDTSQSLWALRSGRKSTKIVRCDANTRIE